MEHMVTLDEIQDLEESAYRVIDRLRKQVFAPAGEKTLARKFTITEASQMVGRTPAAIRNAENDGRLAAPSLNHIGRRNRYTLEQVNAMRRMFDTMPYRDSDTDEPVVLAIQNFKGGVGKSTLTVHLAQYLALVGYRVCVIDCDPQGSTTSLFGLNPDQDLDDGDTLEDFLYGERDSIRYAVRETYFDQIKLVPANLDLYQVEYAIAAELANPESAATGAQLTDDKAGAALNRLRTGIAEISGDFDIVLLDPPPALGMISLSVLRAATALIVPTRPATVDFSSTAHFFTMLNEALSTLENVGYPAEFKFLSVLVNDLDEGKTAHREITEMMRQVFGRNMLTAVMKDSAEIDNACGRMMTVYELDKPITTKEVHKRAKTYLDAVNAEIEIMIKKTWPSKARQLKDKGVI